MYSLAIIHNIFQVYPRIREQESFGVKASTVVIHKDVFHILRFIVCIICTTLRNVNGITILGSTREGTNSFSKKKQLNGLFESKYRIRDFMPYNVILKVMYNKVKDITTLCFPLGCYFIVKRINCTGDKLKKKLQ